MTKITDPLLQHRPATRSVKPALMVLGVVLLVMLLSVLVLRAILNPILSSTPTPVPPPEVQNSLSAPDPGQPCNYLDYQGDPRNPDRIILWCDAGQTALVINTKDMEHAVWKGDNVSGKGSHDVNVRAGDHLATSVTIVESEDGRVDFRVWYDEPMITRDTAGNEIRSSSRITMRSFTTESITETRALGY